MPKLLSILTFFITTMVFSQTIEPIPVVTENKNWTSAISYNFAGATISKEVSYFNNLGKGLQQQSWDVLTGRIWGQEVRYDSFDRPFFQTLSAPIGSAGFGYKNDFIYAGGAPLNNNLLSGIVPVTINIGFPFTYTSTIPTYLPNDPTTTPCVSDTPNSLGWYYSNSNTLDPYQDTTCYPYTKTIFSELNPGTVKAVYGGNKINGQWLQSYNFSMPMEINLIAANDKPELSRRRIIKTVSRGVDGIEAVSFADTDGNMLGAARSGNEDLAGRASRQVYAEIIDKGYVDIHIPVGCGGTVTIDNININHQIRIFDLITEQIVPYTTNATTIALQPGFYRFEDTKNYYGVNKTDLNNITPVRINHKVNYYDYSLNSYDYYDRLIETKQPQPIAGNGTAMKTTFEYDFAGQLTSSTSPDEGKSEFMYRKDGQIRFSQNAEQKKSGSFSYTNYDNLGRPVESGVYTGTVAFFDYTNPNTGDYVAGISTIVDALDGLPQDGRSEQTFSEYDSPSTRLTDMLIKCGVSMGFYQQKFLSGNVSHTYTLNPETTHSWYSYDVYGRVTWMIQQIEGLPCLKTIDYTYDPVDGQLTKVEYQKYDNAERFVHKYQYNLAGQLIDVYTSIDNINFNRQAHYIYNESGALTRTELADNLQGIDYVYNLEGQLKAINHPTILPANDPGGDGVAGSTFAADVFGMSLDYYNGDYTRNNTPKPISTTPNGTDQYNGNIKATRWNTQVQNATTSAYTFGYNKNNWLNQANFGTATATGTITNNAAQDYAMTNLTYDANGNLKTLNRKGVTNTAGSNSMDNFTYKYRADNPNRLAYVKDDQDNPNPNRYNDLRNQETTIPSGATGTGSITTVVADNYLYNDLGQLVTDNQEGILYNYNASGLVTSIDQLTSTTTNPNAEFRTILLDTYANYQDGNHGFVRSGLAPYRTTPPYFLPGLLGYDGNDLLTCPDLGVLNDQNGTALQINGVGTVNKLLKVVPGAEYNLNMDVLVYSRLTNQGYIIPNANGGGSTIPFDIPINPVAEIKILHPNGTVVYQQTVSKNSFDNRYCLPTTAGENYDYYGKHINTGAFVVPAGVNSLTVQVNISHTKYPANTYTPTFKDNYQQTFIDNLKLEVATSTKVAFFYNDRGQRVRKESYDTAGNTTRQVYVRDASGSVMAVHSFSWGPTIRTMPKPIEHSIFGAGRIGVFKRSQSGKNIVGTSAGIYQYELTDHLGNVRAVITKTPAGLLSVTNKTDFYPFGQPMPDRNVTDGNYRYAFQGQEKDPETGMEAFELRLWDGRLGRWLSPDPMGIHHTPYQGMANNPISIIDPTGGYPTPYEAYLMASFVYSNVNITLRGGWALSKITKYNRDSDSGLKASLFERKKENGDTEYAYVYAGTEDKKDAYADEAQLKGQSVQYAQALEIANQLSIFLKQKELTFSGHSLGGGLSNYSSLATDRRSITFDPAWLSKATISKIKKKTTLSIRPSELQTNYISTGLSLDMVQTNSFVKNFTAPTGVSIFLKDFNFSFNIFKVHNIDNIGGLIFRNYGEGKDKKVNCGCR